MSPTLPVLDFNILVNGILFSAIKSKPLPNPLLLASASKANKPSIFFMLLLPVNTFSKVLLFMSFVSCLIIASRTASEFNAPLDK